MFQASEASEAGMDSVEAALEEAEKPKATVDRLRHLDTAEDSRRLEPPEVLRRLTGANAQFMEEVCWVCWVTFWLVTFDFRSVQ